MHSQNQSTTNITLTIIAVTCCPPMCVITARAELCKVLFLALSVTFCLCMKYLENRKTDLRQIRRV